ncbi:YbaB/EbfC family nucleoid-associated protein [Sinosporangium album]|uniref:YbaB/EbfC family nucleoid-associated protein n=1 Tax=Sinosporangium album TaxID=504805 RepID=UPI001FDF797D|nr:YbaB/EbfC family nucleoid-associated protein [Sinosporangium album]
MNVDVDKLLADAEKQFARADEIQQVLTSAVGRAKDEDGLVSVEFAAEGLRELELHPKAMRLGSAELAEKIKKTIRDAADDLSQEIDAAMNETFGEAGNPLRFLNDPDAALQDVRSTEAAFNRTFDDVMGELERIRRRLEL